VKSFCKAGVSIYTNFRFVIFRERKLMKKLFWIGAILFSFTTTWAQEFKLTVTVRANNIVRNLTFGFDPSANDTMTDAKWGEVLLPSAIGPGDFDARMSSRILNRSYLISEGNNGGPVDIRQKPATDSFILQYELYNNAYDVGVPVKFDWDNTNIPPIIKHIYLTPEGNPDIKVRLDMKVENHLDVPARTDSLSLYNYTLVTILYNRETMAVHQAGSASIDLAIYPNPMDSRSNLHFTSDKLSKYLLSAYDITGKKVFEKAIISEIGENTVDLNKKDFGLRSGMYLLRLTPEDASLARRNITVIVQ
jgi:hypothetical protein